MTTTSSVTGTSTNYSTTSTGSSSASSQLNEQDFLKLMTQQLQNQDPLHPVDNAEFFSQMAQLSTVSGIDQLNTSFSNLSSQLTASQSLQGASLIGHSVLVSGSTGNLDSNGLSGAVEVPSSGQVVVQVHDSSGAVVRTLDLGTQSAGVANFTWDGTSSTGEQMPQGQYTVSASLVSGGSSQAVGTEIKAQVNSVALDSTGSLLLSLQGLGTIAFSQVQEIM